VGKKRPKRPTKEWLKRSVRAKRGWVTRRKLIVLETHINKAKGIIKSVKGGKVGKNEPRKKRRTISELESILAKQAEEIATLKLRSLKKKAKRKKQKLSKEDLAIVEEQSKLVLMDRIEFLTRNWVDAVPKERIRVDGSIALEYSRARHRKDSAQAWNYLAVMDEKGELDRACQVVAEFMNLPLREIYTLWFSP
jgi:hypothetical protein